MKTNLKNNITKPTALAFLGVCLVLTQASAQKQRRISAREKEASASERERGRFGPVVFDVRFHVQFFG